MSGEQEDATPYQRFVGCAHPLNSCARGDSPSKFAGQDLPSTFTCMRLPVDAQPLLARAKGNRIECNLLHCVCRLLAQSGPTEPSAIRPLWGAKPTSASDIHRTITKTEATCCRAWRAARSRALAAPSWAAGRAWRVRVSNSNDRRFHRL
jgi:hypothetical protein